MSPNLVFINPLKANPLLTNFPYFYNLHPSRYKASVVSFDNFNRIFYGKRSVIRPIKAKYTKLWVRLPGGPSGKQWVSTHRNRRIGRVFVPSYWGNNVDVWHFFWLGARCTEYHDG